MNKTDIPWTGWTINAVHGCSRVSAGCRNCYAERISRRFEHTEHPWTPEHAEENVQTKPEKVDAIAKGPYSDYQDWAENIPYGYRPPIEPGNHPPRIFIDSMGDLFHEQVDTEFIRMVLDACRSNPKAIYQVLTKRPDRAAELSNIHDLHWPENLWVGTSVEDASVVDRIDALRATGAETLFVSFEPLIGPAKNADLSGIDWMIVGGESHRADQERREMELSWVYDLLDRAREEEVAFFYKQDSARYPNRNRELPYRDGEGGRLIEEYPGIPQVTLDFHNLPTGQHRIGDFDTGGEA